MKKNLFMVTAALALTIQIQGQTIINAGPVSGTWTASGSPYLVMGNVFIQADSVLKMETGVTVKFNGVHFGVYGQLLAMGLENDTIFFIPYNPNGIWGGLSINTPDTCKFSFCCFKYCLNLSEGKGGAIYAYNSNVEIKNSSFSYNSVNQTGITFGGAICLENCNSLIYSSNFLFNICYGDGFIVQDPSGANGGAICCLDGTSLIKNNFISQNEAICHAEDDDFAKSEVKGGGIYVSGNSVVENNSIVNNSCSSCAEGNSMFASAWATSFGGGIYSTENCIIKNNLIISNESHAHAYASENSKDIYEFSCGGGVYGGHSSNNTIFSNICTGASSGSGTYGVTLKNCIVWNNTGSNTQVQGTAIYSCIQGGFAGQGNISSDPKFITGPQGNYYLKQSPCQLLPQSPCVDTGDPSSELIIGTTRTDEFPDTGRVDMGFHYYCSEPKIEASFSANTSYGSVPISIEFNNQTFYLYCNPVLRTWDFENDGTIDSYEENPFWTFSQPGVYSVKLVVTALSVYNTLITDTIIKENYIQVCLLNSDFSQDVPYGTIPLMVNFYDASIVENTELNGWQWDFQNDEIIDSYEQNPTFIYNEPGIYSVILIIQDTSLIFSDTTLKEGLITICSLHPGFYAGPLSGVIPLPVQFYDTTKVEFTQIGSWEWDFNNDGIYDSQEQNPEWIYDQVGFYTVKLIIIDTSGLVVDTLTKENYIETHESGIESNSNQFSEKLKIFPNPFTNDIFIEFEFDQLEKATVQIFDIEFKPVATIAKNDAVNVGKEIWKWENLNNDITPGIYYISLTTSSGKQYIKKCIKVD